MEKVIITKSSNETIDLGKRIAKHLFKGSVITLNGDLGAGKTTFVGGVAKGLGIEEKVTSPTFNILKCYFNKPISLYHIDAYRLDMGNKDIGLEEFIEGDGTCLIEWPIYIKEMIPSSFLDINIHNLGDDKREIRITSNDKEYDSIVEAL